MLITDEELFCSELSLSIPELSGIDENFRKNGLSSAEKQLASYVRKAVKAEDYLKVPYYPRENAWAYGSEDDYAAAERIMRGEMMSCGFMYKFPDGKIDWEINPTDNGLKEWTWQLSRHHEWRCLAKCYRETRDEKYAKCYVYQLTSWCAQALCPENASGGATFCWRTLEAGLRMIKNWHYAFFSFLSSPEMTDHVVATYIKSIWEHGYRIRNFCTSGNWLSTELTGLWHIGALYPFLKNAAEWKEYAEKRIVEQLDVQIYPDGFQYELTTGYHGVVLLNYTYLLDTAKAIGEKLPDGIFGKLEKAYGMYEKLCAPDGRTPDLNDGSRAGVKGWLAAAKEYFPHREDYLWFATDGKEGKKPDYTSVALPYSGMAVMRTGWGKNDTFLFMESAPFGYGHQHEDKLNVIMYACGKDVLPDSGSYSYDTSEMRKFIISSRAHNVAMVDDFGQNRRATHSFPPENIRKLSDLRWSFMKDVDTAEGVYDQGFGPALIKVTHRRKVVFFKTGLNGSGAFAVVIDRFESMDGGAHKLETHYQMPFKPYSVDGNVFNMDYGDNVTLSLVSSVKPEIVAGQKEPYWFGWRPVHAPGGTEPEHLHAPAVRYIAEGKTSFRSAVVLYPSESGSNLVTAVKLSEDVNDTRFTLTVNGKEVALDEKDYPCIDGTQEKLILKDEN